MSREFIHSLNECLLSDYYMRGTGDTAVSKRQNEQNFCLHDACILSGRENEENKEQEKGETCKICSLLECDKR